MKDEKPLDAQQAHWENTFLETDEMFGDEPSEPARIAAEVFKKEGKNIILELGAGQGRDTMFFAREGFHVYALDYSPTGLKAIQKKAEELGVSQSITTVLHDIRSPSPLTIIHSMLVTPICSSVWHSP